MEQCRKIVPVMTASSPQLVVVGPAPTADDESRNAVFADDVGQLVRKTLADVGIDPEQVIYTNLTRCRPLKDSFDTKEHEAAEKKCRAYWASELLLVPDAPVLLLGERSFKAFMSDKKIRFGGYRGLWVKAMERDCFVTLYPGTVMATVDKAVREANLNQFRTDLRRMSDRLLGRESESEIKVRIYESPFAATKFLTWLARLKTPWAFDIESYDGKKFPSRKEVSTDPCHPDFRLRGIAFAWSKTDGAWVDCRGAESRIEEVRKLFTPAFMSPADKWAFNGPFDEEGIVYSGWSENLTARRGDGMLAMIALGDGQHESLRLEKAIVDILGRPQYWNGMDKGKMRDISLDVCARNAVGDACYTFELCEVLHGRLQRGEYIEWRRS